MIIHITPSQKSYLFKAGEQQVDSCRLSAIRYWYLFSSGFDYQKKFSQFTILLRAYNLLMSGVDLSPVLVAWSQSWWGDTWRSRSKGRGRGEGEIGWSSVTGKSTDRTCRGHSQELWGFLVGKTCSTAGCNITLDLLDLQTTCNCGKAESHNVYSFILT